MIAKGDVKAIGRTLKPHGLKGELAVAVDYDIDFDSIKCLVVDIEGILVPFFVGSWRSKGADTYLLNIDDITTEEAASELAGKEIFILKSDAEALDMDCDEFLLSDLVGFEAYDKHYGHIGAIDNVDETTENVIITITDSEGNDILLPFNEDFIVAFDEEGKEIEFDLPEGILSLNK